MLPKPVANMEEYNRILEIHFRDDEECRENYRKYQAAYRQGYSMECSYLPVKMDYEVSRHCNFRCTMCLISEGGDGGKANMSFEDFRESIDGQRGLVEIKLQGLGEPLLNPDFFFLANYAVAKNIWVRTTTNASLLHINNNYKKLIDSKIGEIQISVDGARKETFEGIRRGSNFEQVVDNCKMLNEYAESKGEQWRTSCWMLVQKENADEVEELLELATYMKFTRLTYSIAVSDWGKDNWAEINNGKEVTDLFTDEFAEKLIQRGKELGIAVTFWDGKDKYIYNEKKNRICAWLFGRAFISSNMRIVPCCVVSDSNTCDLGDARDFYNEWNSDKYYSFRKLHLEGKIPKMCQNCYEGEENR